MRRFNVTYEIVTPESAERGDYEDCGFIGNPIFGQDPSKWSVDGICGTPAAKLKEGCAMRLRDALQYVHPQETDGFTFREVGGRQDYRTGASETRALHAPDKITASSLARLNRVLGF